MSRTLSVLKLGGSVLRDDASYAAAARFLHDRLAARPDERLVVIVSAQYGSTDALLAEAQAIAGDPSVRTHSTCCGRLASCDPSRCSPCTCSASGRPPCRSTCTRPG